MALWREHKGMIEWVDGWMDGWMDGCMYVCMYVCMPLRVQHTPCQLGSPAKSGTNYGCLSQHRQFPETIFGEA